MKPVADKHKSIINIIAHCIENDEKGVKNLLKRNGVDTSVIKSKKALRKAFIGALGKSKAVALDFNRYLEYKKNKNTLNATGREEVVGLDLSNLSQPISNDWGGLEPSDDFSSSTSTTINPTDISTRPLIPESGGGFFNGINWKDLLNTGVNILEIQRDIKLSNDNKEAIETAVQIKQDEINLQPKKSNTSVGLYVALALIGLTLIGGVLYIATKKKS